MGPAKRKKPSVNQGEIRAKKLQPPEAVWHSEGCCSPQNDYKISCLGFVCNIFLKKGMRSS